MVLRRDAMLYCLSFGSDGFQMFNSAIIATPSYTRCWVRHFLKRGGFLIWDQARGWLLGISLRMVREISCERG